MKAKGTVFVFVLASLYSAVLIIAEALHSQDYVRPYYADIEGSVLFFAVNTTISTALLWACALIFGICLTLLEVESTRRRIFYLSQVLVFAYLGLDDRFMFHEILGERLGIADVYLILGLGILEMGTLLFLGEIDKRSASVRFYLLAAGGMFMVMVYADGFMGARQLLRLSIEDLSKTWGGLFLCLMAWRMMRDEIDALRRRPRGALDT